MSKQHSRYDAFGNLKFSIDCKSSGKKLTGKEKEKAIKEYLKKESNNRNKKSSFISLEEMRKRVAR